MFLVETGKGPSSLRTQTECYVGGLKSVAIPWQARQYRGWLTPILASHSAVLIALLYGGTAVYTELLDAPKDWLA